METKIGRYPPPLALAVVAGMVFLIAHARAAEHPDIEKIVSDGLRTLETGDTDQRRAALHSLEYDLRDIGNKTHVYPNDETRMRLSSSLAPLYQKWSQDRPQYSIELGHIVNVLAANGNESVKPLLLEILASAPDKEKRPVLFFLGRHPHLRGDDVYKKTEDLIRQGVISWEGKYTFLARIDSGRARGEILNVIQKSTDAPVVMFAARALQDEYRQPNDYQIIIPRLYSLGLDRYDAFRGGDGLFWIDNELLSQHIHSAKGEHLIWVLKLVAEHGHLHHKTIEKSMTDFDGYLLDVSPEVRSWAAKALYRAAGYDPKLYADRVIAKLESAAEKEQDISVKRKISEELDKTQRLQAQWKKLLERVRKERGLQP